MFLNLFFILTLFIECFYFRANEYVRKVFSCDFMGRRSATELARKQFIDKVKSNNLDYTSCEVQSITNWHLQLIKCISYD